MALRPEVEAFLARGPLPPERTASERDVGERQTQLAAIPRPVSLEEAHALMTCFGDDTCYGLAWTLLQLIETGPQPLLAEEPRPDANRWFQALWKNQRKVRRDTGERRIKS